MTEDLCASEALLQQLFMASGRVLDAHRQQQFLTYMRELQRWNRIMNLTTITDAAQIIRKHFLGSLDFLRAFTPTRGLALLDVGTGAGFPGIPLKLWHPELATDLLESSRRKGIFLQHLCLALGLQDVRCLVTRVELLADDATMHERYDVIVSRGVGGLRRWFPAALALLRVGGRLVLEKGPDALTEVEALAPSMAGHGGVLAALIPVPGESRRRTLVVISKRGSGQKV